MNILLTNVEIIAHDAKKLCFSYQSDLHEHPVSNEHMLMTHAQMTKYCNIAQLPVFVALCT